MEKYYFKYKRVNSSKIKEGYVKEENRHLADLLIDAIEERAKDTTEPISVIKHLGKKN